MKLRLLLLEPALAAALLAQPAAPSGAQPQPGALEGTVIDSVTRAPIPTATVSMAGSQGFSRIAVTDAAGKFQIGGVEPGSYKVEYIHARGYLYDPHGPLALSSPVAVADGQHITGIVLGMTPLGAIGGKVVDDDGDPLEGAHVSVMAYDYSGGSKSLKDVDGAVTDDRGQYRIYNLKPGRYLVHAWFSQQPEPLPPNTHREMPELVYAPVYYPNGSDASQAAPSLLTPGAEVSAVDFRLRRAPVYHIRGKLQGAETSGRAARVIAAPCQESGAASEAGTYSAPVQPGGRFEIEGVVPGVYCLTLAEGVQRPTVYASGTVTVADHGLEDVTLTSVPTFAVPGNVLFDGLSGDPPAIQASLYAPSPLVPAGGMARVVGGQFTITGASPGDYQATLYSLPTAMYLKAMRYGADDVSDGIVPVKADGSTLTLVVGTDAGQLSGTVQTANNDPAIDRPVNIVPPDALANRQDLFRSVRTDSTGRFQATGLAPGDYTVYAWDDADVPMATDAEFRKQFASLATPVTISPSGAVTVTLKAIPAEEIRKVKERL
jgi:hypothetical protein